VRSSEADEVTIVEPGSPASDESRMRDAAPGSFIGRYVVVEHVGTGAMGQVLRAYDPKLGREVAIKRVRAGTREPDAQARLVREARAMAQLSHPNVVAVYDVEADGESVALAMEYVAGGTLRDWLTAAPRSSIEILQVLQRAGEGLAAAHRAELVHRDFKPANVLVADDGRVKVTDFGLAKPLGSRSAGGNSAEALRPERSGSFDDEALTRAGTVMGTPRYMAPEQHAGEDADARADQYAYCVTAWEVLTGAPPFSGTSFEALVAAKRQGPPVWTKGTSVPASVVSALRRGLEHSPSARWPNMNALLTELDRWRGRARLRRATIVLGSLVAMAGLGVGLHLLERLRASERCVARGEEIAETWPGRAEAVHAGVDASDVPYARTTIERLVPRLDAWAAEWSATRHAACIAHTVDDEMTSDTYERAEACLDESRERVATVLELLASSDVTAIRNAIITMAAQRTDRCADDGYLRGRAHASGVQAEEMRRLRRLLARAEALQGAGQYDTGEEIARTVAETAESLESPTLVAEARFRLGTLLELRGEYDSAVKELASAYFLAAHEGADRIAFEAAMGLAFTIGNDLADVSAGLQWGDHARVAAARAGEEDPVMQARLLANLAAVQRAAGSYREAKTLNEEALVLRERALGSEHPDVATSLNNLGLVLAILGRLEEAKAMHERALGVRERALGPDHPHVASSLDNLAAVHRSAGQYEQAKALNQRARTIWEAALGPDHPSLAVNLNALAELHIVMQSHEEARAVSERALEIREKTFGPDHPSVAFSLDVLSAALWGLGESENALAARERSLAIREKMFGPDHVQVAHTVVAIAEYRSATDALEEAAALYARALALWEAQGHGPMVARVCRGASEVALRRHRLDEAVTYATRAVDVLEGSEGASPQLSDALFVLARAVFEQGREPERATALARRALEMREANDDDGRERVGRIEAWLDEHG
jgi:eukaryotic-like serine/threonine-protein kinase